MWGANVDESVMTLRGGFIIEGHFIGTTRASDHVLVTPMSEIGIEGLNRRHAGYMDADEPLKCLETFFISSTDIASVQLIFFRFFA